MTTTSSTLEAAILENPDDEAPYLVYADWLLATGDPRGELIMLQHDADEASGGRKTALRRAANALLDNHAAYFLGPLAAAPGEFAAIWRYGYVRRLELWWRDREDALSRLAAVLQHPSFQFVVDLQIAPVFDRSFQLDVQGVIDTLTSLRRPAAVCRLDLGITPGHRVTTEFTELGELVAALPRLERIRLREWHEREARPQDPVHEITIQRARRSRRV